jgi:Zn-dependent protease
MNVFPEPGEQVLVTGDAIHVAGPDRRDGSLVLTDRRLLFVPRQGPAGAAVAVAYAEIAAVRPANAFWLFPAGVAVVRAGGGAERFDLKGRDQWRQMIETVREGALAGAGAGAGAGADDLLARIGSILRPGPVDPVVSWPAVAAWIAAPFAFVPVLGLLPALALLVFAGILLAGGKRAHDRRAGVAALALGAGALACWGVAIASAFVQGANPQGVRSGGGESTLVTQVVQVAILVMSVVLHECGHGLAAYWAGDTTALRARRLTLNPIPHVDLFGSVVLPAILIITGSSFLFGWAKPVPVNPGAFRRKKLGNLAVSIAGVSANLLTAMISFSLLAVLGAAVHFLAPEVSSQGFWLPGHSTRLSGVPLAGVVAFAADVLKYAALINMVLFFFNLLPIPPLDGSHVLELILPRSLAEAYAKLRPFGFIILVVCLTAGVLDFWYVPMGYVLGLVGLVVGAVTGLG